MSKSGSKSARIGTLLEQLQKLCLAVSESRNQLEKDNEQLRYITNKLQQMLSTQEKCRKDLMTKFPDGMSTLLLILETSNDSQLTLNVMGCLSELLTSGKRASVLAAKGTVDIVLKIIINASHESPPNEEVILLGHVLLTKVGPKDRKFCLKARLTGALQVTMNTIRNNTSNFRVLQCTLLVVKQYTSNAVNCNTLGKAGAVSVLFKIVTACGHKRITCLKLALEVIAALVKSKSSASKAVNYGAVPVLLQMFSDWHRTDHHNRQAGVRKAIAGVLKSITMTKSGKKAFIQSDGIKVLYSLSLETLDSRELDSVNVLCSQILRRSFPKNKLPLPCSSSPLSFTILDIDSASTNNVNVQKEPEASEDSGGESSDGESEEEVSASTKEDKEETASQGPSDDSAPSTDKKQKPRDDLYMYEKFFPELYEYQVESDDSLDEEPILPNTIMIPTASDDPLSPMSSFCNLYASNTDQMDNTCQDPYGISVRDPPIGTSPPQTSASSTSNECTSRCSSAASNEIHSVLPFIKQAMPEIHGHYSPAEPESLGPKKNTLQKTMIFRDIDRLIQPQKVVDKVVYDLDALLKQPNKEATLKVSSSNTSRKGSASSNSSTSDSEKMSSDGSSKTLKFESRFECGNLRKAIQIREHEYDLILNPDINCRHHHQWFYFEVSNMDADVPYKFNIVNCEKINSQFNFGMQPVLYSSQEALNGRPGWVRSGTNVCYYRNYFARQQNGCQRSKTYFTSTFTITFPYSDDTCYLAYHYPYSFTMLQDHLSRLEVSIPSDIFYRRSTLCHSLAGNPCDVITITAAPRRKDSFSLESFRNRPYVFLSARVHPGESNSSWVMKGVLDFLLSSLYTAKNLRERFIFKIVPMLNVDGVINGCHRCSLSGDDLNRRWSNPSMILHPTIYHTKGLLQYLQAIDKTPIVFCDFHGHSRKKNVFMYGCSKASTISASSSSSSPDMDESASVSNEHSADLLSESDSTSSMDASEIVEDMGYRTLPSALHNIAPAFFLGSCSFIVEPSKESTARVVVWREIGVLRSYTMESTYSGCDQGPYKGCHLGTRELEEMGRFFCAGLLRIARPFMHRDQVNHSQLSNHSTESSENKDNWIRTSELFVPVSSVPCEYGGSSEENT